MKCWNCGEQAIAVDLDYDEGYCARHWQVQQSSNEPVEYYRLLDDEGEGCSDQ